MSTILCLEDFTCALAQAAHVLRDNGYEVLSGDNKAGLVEVAAHTRLDGGAPESSAREGQCGAC